MAAVAAAAAASAILISKSSHHKNSSNKLKATTLSLPPSYPVFLRPRNATVKSGPNKSRGPIRTPMARIHQDPLVSDLCAAGISAAIALSLLRFWEETAKRRIFDQNLNRKLVHISIGLVFLLCWPLFSAGHQGALLAALTPGINIIRMLLVGSGMWKDEATVRSMSRFGDRRELLKGPLYYATTITVACAIFWRTSPIAIAAVCNLCAGDGIADIVGRRFGTIKLPYNKNKSVAGSMAMAVAGFLASLGFMHYFASFGYVGESWEMVFGFLVISLASTLVESLPLG